MELRLAGSVCQGSGANNEDGWGYVGEPGNVEAAWILDGVTGINDRAYLPAASDAAWFVARACHHLSELAGGPSGLDRILAELVARLVTEQGNALEGKDIPDDYDPPAACLVLVKKFGNVWRAARLGDSCLLARSADGDHRILTYSPNNAFDNWLAGEAGKRRATGMTGMKELLAAFRPQHLASRRRRNSDGGHSVLEAHRRALAFAERVDLGNPEAILLCTDGYYRAVDHYRLLENESLLRRADVDVVLKAVREVEAADPECARYPRYKPADDATAVLLAAQSGS